MALKQKPAVDWASHGNVAESHPKVQAYPQDVGLKRGAHAPKSQYRFRRSAQTKKKGRQAMSVSKSMPSSS